MDSTIEFFTSMDICMGLCNIDAANCSTFNGIVALSLFISKL